MAVKHCNHLDSTIDWPSNGRNRADGPLSSKQTNKQLNRRRTKPSEPFHDHRCRPTASFEVLVVACIVWHFLEAFEADTQSQRMALGFQNVKFRLSWRTVGHLLGTRWWWSCSVAESWGVSVGEVEAQVYIFLVASSVLVLASKIACGIEFKVITCIHCIVYISCLSSLLLCYLHLSVPSYPCGWQLDMPVVCEGFVLVKSGCTCCFLQCGCGGERCSLN